MKRKITLTILLACSILLSCKKENSSLKNSIRVGNEDDVSITRHNFELIGYYYDPRFFLLDLDQDGIDDIELKSSAWGSPAIGRKGITFIRSMHDGAKLLGNFTDDTLFFHLSYSKPIHYGGDTYDQAKYLNYSCNKTNPTDQVVKITPVFKIMPLNKGDVMSTNNTFHSDSITMTEEGYKLWLGFDGRVVDTIINKIKVYKQDCSQFPQDQEVYIGIKLYSPGSDGVIPKFLRLGWIRLRISEVNKIMIYESAIQK